MSIPFVLHGCTLLATTECTAEFSVCMGVHGCGWPISTRVICCGMASRVLMNIAPISVSAADVITVLMIYAMFNTEPLFSEIVASFDSKKFPPARMRDPSSLRYEA